MEVSALTHKGCNRNGPPRGRSAQPPRRGAGFRGQPPRSASAPVRPPPRDRTDVQCVDCNRKGHTALECRQPKVSNSRGHASCVTRRGTPPESVRRERFRSKRFSNNNLTEEIQLFLAAYKLSTHMGSRRFDAACDNKTQTSAISFEPHCGSPPAAIDSGS